MSGVYAIIGPTGTRYIGSSLDIDRRFRNHAEALRRGKHQNPHLQQAWAKADEAVFTFTVLEVVPPADLLLREQFHLDAARPDVYNCGIYAECSAKGIKLPESTRAKMSASHIGHKVSNATKAKIGAANSVNRNTPEHKAKLLAANLGKRQSAETRAKRSRALIGMKCPKSVAHRLKLSLARREVPLSDRHRAAIRTSCRTPEHRAKLRAAWERRRAAI